MKRVLAFGLMITWAALAIAQSATDESFYKKAAEGGLAEVETGKLAQSKGNTQAVKDFGAQMVADHTNANSKLARIATAKGVDLPESPSMKHQAMMKKLKGLSGAEFDRAYIEAQIADHKAMAELMQEQIEDGKDAQANAFASETLPKVQQHLKMAQQIAQDLGKGSARSSTSR